MKLIKKILTYTIVLVCLFLIAAKSTQASDTADGSFSVLIPKSIDLGTSDSATFSIKVKGNINDQDMIAVTADSTVEMTRINDSEYSGAAEVVLEDAHWYGSDLNADTYKEKTGTITFEEEKAGSYTGQLNFTICHKKSYNIFYETDGGQMPDTYPEFYYSGVGVDSLPVPEKEGYEFLGWRKKNDKIIDILEYDENQFFIDAENVNTEFNYNSDTDSLFENTSLICITDSAETVEIKFRVNRDANLIFYSQLFENEDSNFTAAFHKEHFETVKIKGENNEALEFSLYNPIFFKKGNYTLTMQKGNASQNNLGSIMLGLSAFNDYDYISPEATGDITLSAVFKPVVSDKSAYLDYQECINVLSYCKNIVFSDKPIPGEIQFYGYYVLTAIDSPYEVVAYEIGDTIYVTTMYSGVTIYAPENCAGLFSNSFELENIEFNNFNTSKVKNMEAMFGYGTLSGLDVSGFDTSNVENMNYLFYGMNLDNVTGLENLNVSSVKSMVQTFCQTSKTGTLELSWNTSSLEDMQGIFCWSEIDTIDLSSWILKDGIKVESAFEESTINIIKTPQMIPANVDGSFGTYRTYFDSSDNYKEYPAGSFPTGINESHTLVSEKP